MKTHLLQLMLYCALVCPSWGAAGESPVFRRDFVENGVAVYHAVFESGRKCQVLLGRPADRNYVPISRSALTRLLAGGGHLIADAVSGRSDINCHGFSCQKIGIPHLPQNVWIEPGDFRVLLMEYFEKTPIEWFSHAQNWQGVDSFEHNPNIQAGDLVVMALGPRIQHSGLVVFEGGQKMVLSKLDEEMVVVASLANLVERYGINTVGVFRRKNSSQL